MLSLLRKASKAAQPLKSRLVINGNTKKTDPVGKSGWPSSGPSGGSPVAPRIVGAAPRVQSKAASLEKFDYDPLGGRFRQVNKLMYSMSSSEMSQQFTKGIDLIRAYHRGYEHQMKKWPQHPLDRIIPFLKSRLLNPNSAESAKQKKRREQEDKEAKKNAKTPTYTRPIILDMGCGTCRLSRELAPSESREDPCSVISIDFAPAVTTNLPARRTSGREYGRLGGFLAGSCNNLPILHDDLADAAVFSLSLMGTDWPTFIKEASRLLKVGGFLIVAEVDSRIVNFKRFGEALEAGGVFAQVSQRFSLDNYFSIYYLKKIRPGQAAVKNIDHRLLRIPQFQVDKHAQSPQRAIHVLGSKNIPVAVSPGVRSGTIAKIPKVTKPNSPHGATKAPTKAPTRAPTKAATGGPTGAAAEDGFDATFFGAPLKSSTSDTQKSESRREPEGARGGDNGARGGDKGGRGGDKPSRGEKPSRVEKAARGAEAAEAVRGTIWEKKRPIQVSRRTLKRATQSTKGVALLKQGIVGKPAQPTRPQPTSQPSPSEPTGSKPSGPKPSGPKPSGPSGPKPSGPKPTGSKPSRPQASSPSSRSSPSSPSSPSTALKADKQASKEAIKKNKKIMARNMAAERRQRKALAKQEKA